MLSLQHILPFGALYFSSLCAAQSSTPSPAELAQLGLQFETSQHASPDLSWYDVPANFSDSLQPGVPLKIEYITDLTNYTVPGGLSMGRFIYTTLDVHGRVIPASGYVLWPYHELPANNTSGYDTVLWAHGTSGLFQACAPSNYRSLQYHFMVPYLIANQGMAVVAPDYAGHGVGAFPNGTKIYHPWATSPSGANDMAYALTAARVAFPEYLKPAGSFVAMGHSEGGRMTWGFVERQAVSPIPGYRGTTLIAPASSPIDIIEDGIQNPQLPWAISALSLQSLTIGSVTAVYPSYKLAGFTDLALDIFQNAYERYDVCLPTSNILFGSILANITKPGWQNATEVKAWNDLTRVGNKRFAGPMLLIAGDYNGSDGIIPYDGPFKSAVLTTVHGLCDAMKEGGWNESLRVMGYQSATHFPVIQASERVWLDWIKQRFNPASPTPLAGCSIEYVEAFRGGGNTVHDIAPNFLVEKVANATTDIWQYSL